MEEEDLPEPEPEPQELGWLKSDWSDVALRRQLDVLDRAAGSNVDYGDNYAESSIVELSDRAGRRLLHRRQMRREGSPSRRRYSSSA